MEPPPGPRLLQQAEKILLRPIHPHLISYCPTMDLIALVTDEENLDVYRINGQRAFGLKHKSEDVVIEALRWQWNGAGLAVAWSDGSVDIVGTETGKVVHGNVKLAGDAEDEEHGKVGYMGWGLNFIEAERVKRRTGEAASANGKKAEEEEEEQQRKMFDLSVPTTEEWDVFRDETSLDDFLQRQPDFTKLDIAPDLPDQLAMMDTESLLPKLPVIPLPPTNPMMRFARQPADAGAFSTQVEVDGLLHSQHLRDPNSVDMFLRCTEGGSVHPSIYDSMEAVDVRLPEAWDARSKVLMHASHPYACTHSLLMEVTTPSNVRKRIAWVPLTLGFIPSAGIYLHLIAAKTAQLQNLLSYLSHTLTRIQTYFAQTQDLPGRFMMNIGETLQEQNQGDLVTNLYHLACTGHCPQVIHDWLVDDLAEQGHRRWDNAVSSGLSTVVQLLHENLLPALERCSIIISRLKGLAEFHDRDWIFSGPLTDFDALFDVLKTLSLLANTALLYATEERRCFASFSKWLRYCIDFEATEPGSQSRAEMESQPPDVHTAIVLDYIQYAMSKSDVKAYLTKAEDDAATTTTAKASSYDETKKAIEQQREASPYDAGALCVEKVLGRFGEGVRGLLKQVSIWQENNISMDSGIVLEEGDVGAPLDMRMVVEVHAPRPKSTTLFFTNGLLLLQPDTDCMSTYVVVPSTSQSSVTIHRLSHDARVAVLQTSLRDACATTLTAKGYAILDAKFADDATLLLLVQATTAPKTCSLVTLTYVSLPTVHTHPISYRSLPAASTPSTFLPSGHAPSAKARHAIHLSRADVETHTRHVFEGRFTPLKLVVNGRRGRRVVVVLGSDRKHYRVLDLDFGEGVELGEEDGSEGDRDVEMGGA